MCRCIALALLVGMAPLAAQENASVRRTFQSTFADYNSELRAADGRVDVDTLTARLTDLGVTTYYWLIWHAPTDWDDLTRFLPKALAAGIEVWVYLVPPSESPPHTTLYSEPFRLDYGRWAEEIAQLSVEHKNLTAWVIDDFYANRAFFTPAALKEMQMRARRIQPTLAFLPLMYYGEISRGFVESYREVIDGVVAAYPRGREDIEAAWGFLNDVYEILPGQMSFPWSTPSSAGDFAAASQSIQLNAQGPYRLLLRERDDFTGPTSGYHWKQVLVDDAVVWEDDAAGGDTAVREVVIDLAPAVQGKTTATLSFRLLDKKGVSNFGLRWELAGLAAEGLRLGADFKTPEKWRVTRQGAFEVGFGEGLAKGRGAFHVPFFVMTAGHAGEFKLRHGDPASPERIAEWLRMSLDAWRDGKCDGVVTYCLDKTPASATFAPARALFREYGRPRKLIEFGWDEPDTAFMRSHSAAMQATPFDGCVFHVMYTKPDGGSGNFTWECWGKRAFTEAELAAARNDLAANDFGRFTENFLRFNTTPADIDWFDDFGAVLNNARLAAKIAREGKCPGLLFDIEQYGGPLFEYAKQRDAATKSWDAYAAQVALRGREVMAAFQEGFPDLVVFLTFGYSLPWVQSDGGKKPLAACSYGLLAPFMDGLVEGARGRTRIVDGYELAYGYKGPTRFPAARKIMRTDLLPLVKNQAAYARALSVSFGLWLDHDWRNRPWDTQDFSKNFYTPDALETTVRAALRNADDYVWIYSETPRWWTPEGPPAKLPEAYAEALRRARTQ